MRLGVGPVVKIVYFFTAMVLSGCTFNANVSSLTPTSLITAPAVISKTISFDATVLNIAEGSAAVINIFLSEKLNEDITVTLSLMGDASAIQTLPLTVTVPAGTLSKSLTVQTIDDFVFSANRSLTLSMTSSSAAVSVGVSSVIMNIADNDLPTLVLSASAQSVTENVGTYTLTAMLNAAAISNVTIPFTLSGTAVVGSGQDYTMSQTGSLTILAGATQANLVITILNDAIYESSETVVVSLGSPTGATLGAPNVFTLTIADDDLGAFTISGISGAADSTADNYLIGGLAPKVNWSASSGAISYDVTVYASNGTTVVCATQNTTLTTYDFSTCNLTVGTIYKAVVHAKSATVTMASSNSPFSFTVNTTPIANNDGPVRILKNASPITLQVVTASDAATRGTVADSDADVGDTISISAVTQGSVSGTVTNTATTVSYTPASGFTGVETFTYTITDTPGATATATVTIHVFDTYTWTGKVSANWNVNGNWCGTITNNACNGTTGFPSSLTSTSHTAIFDGTCNATGHNCAASINTAVNTQGLLLKASYPGTLTQLTGTGNTLTVGGGGLDQAGGTFVGGNANLTFQKFNLTAGSFTATSANLTVYPNPSYVADASTVFTVGSAATYTHNSGKLIFFVSCSYNNCMNYTVNPGTGLNVYDLDFQFYEGSNGYNFNWWIVANTAFIVNRNLKYEVTSTQGGMRVSGGNIDLYGNLAVYTGSQGGSTIVTMKGTANQTYFGNLTSRGPNLKINKTAGTVTAASAHFATASLELIQGTFTAADGTTQISPEAASIASGASVLKLGAGTIFSPSAMGTLEFLASCAYNDCMEYVVDVGSTLTVQNLKFNFGEYSNNYGFRWNLINGQKFIVNGTFTHKAETAIGYMGIHNGAIDLYGNMITERGAAGGTTLVTMKGTANQTYTSGWGYKPPAFKINKAGGAVTVASTDASFSTFDLTQGTFTAPTGRLLVNPDYGAVANGSTVFNIQSGTVFNANSGTLQLSAYCAFNMCTNYGISTPSSFTINNLEFLFYEDSYGYDFVWNLLGSTSLVVNGNLINQRTSTGGSIAVNGGAISVLGNASFGAGSNGGTTTLNFAGTNAQTVSLSAGFIPWLGNVSITKPSGTLTLATDVNWIGPTQSVSLSSGTIDMNGKNLTVKDLGLNGNTLTKNAGVLTVNGAVVGTGSLFGGTVNP